MYAGIHVCICTCYRDEPWRCLVDVNNGEVFVIYFDFEKGVFWSVNDLSSLFCRSFLDALRRYNALFSQDGRLLAESQNIDITSFQGV